MNKNVPVVILCGGYGTRISEETRVKPKPMVLIGNRPILSHIMGIYKYYGFKKFILALGYKSFYIKRYFSKQPNIQLVYTGKETKTGGRLLRLKKYLNKEKTFMLTYGDGVSSINVSKLMKFHNSHGKIATITATRPPVRFGELNLKKNSVTSFKEKPQVSNGWINGGFFVANIKFLKLIRHDKEILEKRPLEKATKLKQLVAFKHKGFWKCMDVKRDRDELQNIYKKNKFNW